MYKPFIIRKIANPKLKFYKGKISGKPFDGLREFGPVDIDTRKFKKIRLYIVHQRRKGDRIISNYIEKLQKSARNLLKIELEIAREIPLNVRNVIDYIKSIEDAVETPVQEGDIILQILHRRESNVERSFYFQLRIHMLGREHPIPIQSVLFPKIVNPNWAIINNTVLGIYAKCGGKPWHLAESVSTIENKVLYVGYDISRRLQYSEGKRIPRTGTAIVYDNMGQQIYFTKYEIQTEKEVIPKESIKNFMQKVVTDVFAKGREVKAIVIHRDGEIYAEEINGIVEAIDKFRLSLAIIAFPKVAPALIDQKRGNYAEPGLYFYTGKQLVRKEIWADTFYLQSFRFPGPSPRKVNLLKYRTMYLKGSFLQRNLEKIYHDIARQIFYLSRLNWATAKGEAKSPVTVHYAHKASKLLSSGLQPRMLEEDKLFMV